MLVGSRSDVNAGDGYQNLPLNQQNRARFNEAFRTLIPGLVRVTESLPPYDRPLGPVSYGGRNRQKSRPVGVPDWYRPLPGEPGSASGLSREEARLHDGDCGSVHPTVSHGDWARGGEEEEEERRRLVRQIKERYLAAPKYFPR
jgi:hypothetical protein